MSFKEFVEICCELAIPKTHPKSRHMQPFVTTMRIHSHRAVHAVLYTIQRSDFVYDFIYAYVVCIRRGANNKGVADNYGHALCGQPWDFSAVDARLKIWHFVE